jgi:hypothetical protein
VKPPEARHAVEVVTLLALGGWRVARFFTRDQLTAEWRVALYRWAWRDDPASPEPVARAAWRSYVFTLLTCTVCLSVWMTAGVWALWSYGDGPGQWADIVLGAAGLAALIALRLDPIGSE